MTTLATNLENPWMKNWTLEMLGAVHRTDHITLFVKSLIANKSKAELANMGAT